MTKGATYANDLQGLELTNSIMDALLRNEEDLANAAAAAERSQAQAEAQSQRAQLQSLAVTLNTLSTTQLALAPAAVLHQLLHAIMDAGPRAASLLYQHMRRTALEHSTATEIEISDKTLPSADEALAWDESESVTSLVLLLAAAATDVVPAANFARDAVGKGLVTLAFFQEMQTANLPCVYATAKKEATRDAWPGCTVIGVALMDLEYERLKAAGREKGWDSFNHSFVLVVGPDGVAVYHGWRVGDAGDRGYDGCEDGACGHSLGLKEWIEGEEGQCQMGWEMADAFVANVERLVKRKGKGEEKVKQVAGYFGKCFGLSLRMVYRVGSVHLPLPEAVDLKLQVRVLDNFQMENLSKWKWT